MYFSVDFNDLVNALACQTDSGNEKVNPISFKELRILSDRELWIMYE